MHLNLTLVSFALLALALFACDSSGERTEFYIINEMPVDVEYLEFFHGDTVKQIVIAAGQELYVGNKQVLSRDSVQFRGPDKRFQFMSYKNTWYEEFNHPDQSKGHFFWLHSWQPGRRANHLVFIFAEF